jgi:hypothetical protein
MNFVKHIALVSAVALAPAFALAQAPAPATPAATAPAATQPSAAPAKGERRHQRGERLKAADKDGDGAISKAEADAAGMKGLSKHFDKIDANKDGKITREEMRAARKARHDHKGMRGAKPPAPATPAAPATK